jgi:hypothetical protein
VIGFSTSATGTNCGGEGTQAGIGKRQIGQLGPDAGDGRSGLVLIREINTKASRQNSGIHMCNGYIMKVCIALRAGTIGYIYVPYIVLTGLNVGRCPRFY